MRVRASGLGVERGGRRLFADLSFEVASGESLLVMGPNGAGKSSLLRALAGLLDFAAGQVAIEGGDEDSSLGEQAHYLGHSDAMKGALTARENLDFWAGMLGGGPKALDAGAALERFGLAHVLDFPVEALSAGQKRRVALARLLVAPRPLWLLDEPTNSLDAAAQDRLKAAMAAHLADGGLIIAATHAALGLDGQRVVLGGAAVSAL